MSESQIETVRSPSDNPRFTITVDGARTQVTRYGTDDNGCTHFEIADRSPDRDVYPTDRGYVRDGEVCMVTPETVSDASDAWDWMRVGAIESCLYQPTESVAAELDDN